MNISNRRKVWITIICFLPVIFLIFMYVFIIPPLKGMFEDLMTPETASIPSLYNLTFHRFIFTLSHYWCFLAIILIGLGVIITRWCIIRESCSEKKQKSVLIRFVWGGILIGFALLSVVILFIPI